MVEKRNSYNAFSEIVFINYDVKSKKIKTDAATRSIYVKTIEDLIKDRYISKFIKDSAKTGFLMPIYFSVDHDEKEWKWGNDALLFTRNSIRDFFRLLLEANKEKKEVFEPLIVAPTFGGRKE
jgi:hypothetical protein